MSKHLTPLLITATGYSESAVLVLTCVLVGVHEIKGLLFVAWLVFPGSSAPDLICLIWAAEMLWASWTAIALGLLRAAKGEGLVGEVVMFGEVLNGLVAAISLVLVWGSSMFMVVLLDWQPLRWYLLGPTFLIICTLLSWGSSR